MNEIINKIIYYTNNLSLFENIGNEPNCKWILKSGPNKGLNCKEEVVENGFCKKHSINLDNKSSFVIQNKLFLKKDYKEMNFEELKIIATKLNINVPNINNRKILYDNIIKKSEESEDFKIEFEENNVKGKNSENVKQENVKEEKNNVKGKNSENVKQENVKEEKTNVKGKNSENVKSDNVKNEKNASIKQENVKEEKNVKGKNSENVKPDNGKEKNSENVKSDNVKEKNSKTVNLDNVKVKNSDKEDKKDEDYLKEINLDYDYKNYSYEDLKNIAIKINVEVSNNNRKIIYDNIYKKLITLRHVNGGLIYKKVDLPEYIKFIRLYYD